MIKSQTLIRVAVALVLSSVIGCSTVTSVNPIGWPLENDLSAELTGTWMGAEANQLQIHCDSTGRLSYAVTEWKDDQGAFVLETGNGVLRTIGDRVFFNYVENQEGERPTHSFLLLRVMDGQLVIWLPNVDQFRSLVEEQTLKGDVVDGAEPTNVVLTGSSEEIAKALETLDLADLFDWAEPAIVLVRVRGQR
ncbi:MAG: hypothetical protein DRJ65_17060 [Acidobacteria bacterium]|nr:MAG: hypothetical protein DRJ65_17060 [Acidobacteriota bacterium]